MGLGAAAAVGVVGSVAGGLISSQGAKDAAQTGADASTYSANLQNQQYQQSLANEQPYINSGYTGVNALTSNLAQGNANQVPLGTAMDLTGMPAVGVGQGGAPTSPDASTIPQYSWNAAAAGGMPSRTDVNQFSWNPTQQGLEQTPGYQFTLNQGLAAAQNALTARGLGSSDASVKAATNYATGLANTTYNQQLQNAINTNQQQNAGVSLGNTIYNNQVANSVAQNQQSLSDYNAGLNTYNSQITGYQAQGNQYQNLFSDYWANQNNRYNQLSGLATLGANTSVSAGTQGVNSASNVGNAVSNAGAITAAGQQGAASDWSKSLNNITNNPYVNQYIQDQFGSGSQGSASNAWNSSGNYSGGYSGSGF